MSANSTARSDLWTKFLALEPPDATHRSNSYAVFALPDLPDVRVGKGRELRPTLLISLSPEIALAAPTPPIRLRHIEIVFNTLCRVHTTEGITEERLAVVACRSADLEVQHYFLSVLPLIFESLLGQRTRADIGSAMAAIAELFQMIEEPPHKSVQAVWSELLLIERSSDTSRMLAAWRSGVHDKYDFSEGSQRIEVKSSSRGSRIHTFSLDQLLAPQGVTIIIASLLARELVGGSSIRSLVAGIREKCSDPALLVKLETVISRTLGASTLQAFEITFDLPYALQELRYYSAASIPTVNLPVPSGVSNVRFDAELMRSTYLDPDVLKLEQGLFANCP